MASKIKNQTVAFRSTGKVLLELLGGFFDRKKRTLYSPRRARARAGFAGFQPTSAFPAAIETLERRRMLSSSNFFNTIADDVSGPTGAMSSITSGLHAVQNLAHLPLINQPLGQIGQLTDALTSFQGKLDTTLRSLDPSDPNIHDDVQNAIFGALGPQGGLNVLASKKGASQVLPSDVVVITSPSGVDVSLDLGYTSNQFASAIGLGADSVPLKPANNTMGEFSVGLTYHDFHFGYNTTEGAYFRTGASNNELQLTLNGFLPNSFTAGLGFLNVTVTDKTPGTAPSDADLTLKLTADVTGGSNNQPISISAPQLSGGLDLEANVLVQATVAGVPKLQLGNDNEAGLVFKWTLPDVSSDTPFGSGWGAPTLQFNHVQIDLGSMLGSIVQPIAADVNAILKPLQPMFDALEARIPGLSDISEDLGQGSINLVKLSKALSALPGQPSPILNVINEAVQLQQYASEIETLASAASGWIDVGSFNISGPNGQSLLDAAKSALGDLGLGNWSNLISADGGINFDGFKAQVSKLLPGAIGDEVNSLWNHLTSDSDGNGLSFTYPIVTQPGDVVLGMLLGQDKNLITAKLTLKENLDESFPIPIIPLFFIQVTAKGNIDASAQIGYDTRGLQEAIAPLYDNHNFDPNKILDGLWIDPATHVDISSDTEVGPGVGIPDYLTFNISGGLTGHIHANIANPQSLSKIRPFAPGNLTDRIFDVNGRLDAVVTGTLQVGVTLPFVGFVGYDKTWTFASKPLYVFNTNRIDVPTSLIPPPDTPPQLFHFDPTTNTLILNAGPNAYLRGGGLNNDGDSAETFTVNHLAHVVFRNVGGIGDPITTHVIDTFEVSYSGLTQRFAGKVDRVFADMGGGDDSLTVVDVSSPTLYSLHGGDGNDTIDVQGSVDVAIDGGAGNDTINAGNGSTTGHLNSVNGGTGSDTITFGSGLLTNVVPGAAFFIVRDPSDDSEDRILIDNSRSTVDTYYDFSRDVPNYNEYLGISNGNGTFASFSLLSPFDAVTIRSGSGNDIFTGVPSTNSALYGGAGNDQFIIGTFDTGPLPIGTIGSDYPSFTLNGGDGYDSIDVNDSNTSTPRNYLLGVSTSNEATTQISWNDSPTVGYRENLSGIEQTAFTAYATATVNVVGWDTGSLVVEAGEVKLAADSSMWWNTDISVKFTPKITFYDANNNVGDTANGGYVGSGLDANGPYLYLQGGHRIDVTVIQYAGDTTSYSFQTTNATVVLTPDLLLKPYNVSFDGPADSSVYIVSPNYTSPTGTAPDYSYDLESNQFVINSHAFKYTNIGSLVIRSGQGNDNLRIGGYPTQGIAVYYNGGFGTNTIVADDRTDTKITVWEIKPDLVLNLLKYSVALTNVQGTAVLGGQNDDSFTIIGDFTEPVSVDGGLGNDQFFIGEENFLATFHSSAFFTGGQGSDSFNWYGTNNAFDPLTYPVVVDGGAGYNTLVVDDKTRSAKPTFYEFYPNRIKARQTGSSAWADFSYGHMAGVTVSASDNNDTFNVYGTSSDIDPANQVTLMGNGGQDTFVIHPHDAAGNFTLLGNLGIVGGAGADKVTVDNSAETSPSNYGFYNQFGAGTTNVSGFSLAGFGVGGDVEQLQVLAGSGDDAFSIDSYQSTTTALSIDAGAGNDSVTITPSSGNIGNNISQYAALSFDGGSGTNTFSLNNSKSTQSAVYVRNGATLFALQSSSLLVDMSVTDFEGVNLTGGTNTDQFDVEGLASGESLTLHGGGGFSNFYVGQDLKNTQTVFGQIILDGGVDGGSLIVNDSANTTGAQLHIETGVDGYVGSAPGDNLFGQGGSLQFHNLADDPGNGTGMSFALGTGADTVFAGPQLRTTLSISGNAPTSGTFDTLNLALAGAQNPIVHTFGANAGSVTSDNRKTVFFNGFEQRFTDYVFPASYQVVNTLDSGPGSLRQAILDSNAAPASGDDNLIRFSIPGVGAHTIQPLSPLPTITSSVVLDATTQPGYVGQPVIEIDGSNAGNANGLTFASDWNIVNGLAINRFAGASNGGIVLQNSSNNTIEGNYIGTNLAGNAVYSPDRQMSYGVVVQGGDNNSIETNVISGQSNAGIILETAQPGQLPDWNSISSNLIGTSADGNTAFGNGHMGVSILGGGTGNLIGVRPDIGKADQGNVISGNPDAGIFTNSDGTRIAGNLIGTNASGTAALPNGNGVWISYGNRNSIGGVETVASNTIAFNRGTGVLIDSAGTGNTVTRNSIYGNGGLGINLSASGDPANGVTPNDPLDADTGANNLQNYPTLLIAQSSGTQTLVAGTLQSTPSTTFSIELFSNSAVDSSGHGQGQSYLGQVTATTDAKGYASFAVNLLTNIPAGQFISSTATDPVGNTSEFSSDIQVGAGLPSNVVPLQVPGTGNVYLVTSPVGTTLTASSSPTAGVALPSGVAFPFGFLSFTVSGIAAGAAADVTILGLNTSQVSDYFKNGMTPANHSAHWYDFLFGHATDGDNAVGTGMEIIGGTVVLHLIDGQRGDDDLAANGIISDVGGPVFNLSPVAKNDVAVTNKETSVVVNVLSNDSDPDGTINATTVSIVGAATHGKTRIDRTTGAITYSPADDYTGADSFTYQVKDNLGAVSNVATVSIKVNAPPRAVDDSTIMLVNSTAVINELSNDFDRDGTINASTVVIVGAVKHGTTSINPTTGAITYKPVANFVGSDAFRYQVRDNNGMISNVATVSINVVQPGSIKGNDYLDVTGNGASADDTPLAGVKVYLDSNNNGTWDTGELTSNTLADGSYAFTGLIPGTYKVRQVTPVGYVRTSPTNFDYDLVTLSGGQNSVGNNFSNAALGNPSAISKVVYVINGTTPVTDLRDTTKEGDTVEVSFTVVAGSPQQRLTLVSYVAPGSEFDSDSAGRQKIFDTDTGVFGPGTYTLCVSNPHSYFQVDFVEGFAIDHLGPQNSNIFYSAQNRLLGADNGGSHSALTSPASLSGTVYRDTNNNGVIDSGEQPIAGVKVTLTSGSSTQMVVTDVYGVYTFDNLLAGSYTITETQPGAYTDGKDAIGNKGGVLSNDKISGIALTAGSMGTGYNFGEQQTVGPAVAGNQTQAIAWWKSSSGQALIKALNGGQNGKNLGNWLAVNFNNLFGIDAGSANNLTGKTNAQVAVYYQSLFANAASNAEAETLALALATYVTNSTLAGTTATAYGFAVSTTGLGASTFNVGINGAAFGVNNNLVMTISDLLSRTNSRARKGILWNPNCDGASTSAEKSLRNQISSVFDTINNT